MQKLSRSTSLLIVAAVYIAAFFAGLLVYKISPAVWHPLIKFLAADAAATVVVWFFGLLFRNASMYDPYWSVAPIVLIIFYILNSGRLGVIGILYISVLSFWGVRLTMNWIIGWSGMTQQDWRYTMLHEKNKKLWFITNFFGINMMPTLFVFAGMVPAYYAVTDGAGINAATLLGAAVCAGAVVLQIFSDAQMRSFRKDPANKGRNIETGLWKYSRHPNYLGEVSMWWGVWIMQISVLPHTWWTVFAPVAMTLLFVFISIPMMENRLLESKQGYAEYKKATSMLMLLPKRR